MKNRFLPILLLTILFLSGYALGFFSTFSVMAKSAKAANVNEPGLPVNPDLSTVNQPAKGDYRIAVLANKRGDTTFVFQQYISQHSEGEGRKEWITQKSFNTADKALKYLAEIKKYDSDQRAKYDSAEMKVVGMLP